MGFAIVVISLLGLWSIYESTITSHEVDELKRRVRDLEFDVKCDHKDICQVKSDIGRRVL